MKHKYLLIECGRMFDETAHLYQVWVGTGKQADRDYLAIVAHSVACGYYFELWTSQVDEFYSMLLRHYPTLPQLEKIDARDYVRNLKQALRQPMSCQSLSNKHHLKNAISTQYFINSRLNRLKPSASVHTKKT